MEQELSSRIIDLLKRSPHDLTISDIASKLQVERHTAAKHLDKLQAKGLCDYRTVGRSKLWRVADSPLLSLFSDSRSALSKQLSSLLADVTDRITIQDEHHKIIWSNDKKLINRKCYKAVGHNTTICSDCLVKKTFESGIKKQGPGHGGTVKTTPLKKNGETVAVVNITTTH